MVPEASQEADHVGRPSAGGVVSCFRLSPDTALAADEVVLVQEHLRLDPLPRLVQRARQFVDEVTPDIRGDLREVLLLLTSELVTNAVIHARTPFEIGVTVTARSVLVTVHDEDLGHSEPPGTGREGGRGLVLVSSLAAASDVERHPGDGKTAWFRLDRAASGGAA